MSEKQKKYKVWLVKCLEIARALHHEKTFWLWLSIGFWKDQYMQGREPDVAALDVLPF